MRTALRNIFEYLESDDFSKDFSRKYALEGRPSTFIRRFSPDSLLEIFEQANRTGEERKAILKSDIALMVNEWKNLRNCLDEYDESTLLILADDLVMDWDKEGEEEEEEKWNADNQNRLGCLEMMIHWHLERTADLGCKLDENDISELFKGLPAHVLEGLNYGNSISEPSDVEEEGVVNHDELPTPLGTEKEQTAFRKAIEVGLMVRKEDKYEWKGRPCQLGCFVWLLYESSSPMGLDAWFEHNQVAKYKSEYSVKKPKDAKYQIVLDLFV